MAQNTGQGHRRGAVKDRSRVRNPTTNCRTKRGADGRFVDQRADAAPSRGVLLADAKVDRDSPAA